MEDSESEETRRGGLAAWIVRGRTSPALVGVLSYLTVALVGMVLFLCPFATRGGGLGWVDAFFLSMSALCVTGLSPVASLPDTLSDGGFVLLLVLIQLGGVGLVLLGVLLFSLMGRRISLPHARALGEAYVESLRVPVILRRVVVFTVLFEAVGVLCLWNSLPEEAGFEVAVFHAVSAFCNAGFSNVPEGLMRYRTNVGVNVTVLVLVVLGGLGYRVLSELVRRGVSPGFRPSLHTRLVLGTTTFLIALLALLFLALEWRGPALAPLAGGQRLLAALFQSVTTRTAGFNTVPLEELGTATLLLFCLWMVIGGSPGSCAGGMKTVTFVLLLRTAWSEIRGDPDVVVGRRRIPPEQGRQALAVGAAYLLTLMVVVLGLSVLVPAPSHAERPFLAVLFESCSALGTVGLSTGITPGLPAGGKLLLVLTMLLGRVGPLTLVLALAPPPAGRRIRYPEEAVGLG